MQGESLVVDDQSDKQVEEAASERQILLAAYQRIGGREDNDIANMGNVGLKLGLNSYF